MSTIRISCINKDNGNHYNPHESIYRFGWVQGDKGGYFSLKEMISFIEVGNKAYVRGGDGNISYLEVKESDSGNKHVRTIPDSTSKNNLLELKECFR